MSHITFFTLFPHGFSTFYSTSILRSIPINNPLTHITPHRPRWPTRTPICCTSVRRARTPDSENGGERSMSTTFFAMSMILILVLILVLMLMLMLNEPLYYTPATVLFPDRLPHALTPSRPLRRVASCKKFPYGYILSVVRPPPPL